MDHRQSRRLAAGDVYQGNAGAVDGNFKLAGQGGADLADDAAGVEQELGVMAVDRNRHGVDLAAVAHCDGRHLHLVFQGGGAQSAAWAAAGKSASKARMVTQRMRQGVYIPRAVQGQQIML